MPGNTVDVCAKLQNVKNIAGLLSAEAEKLKADAQHGDVDLMKLIELQGQIRDEINAIIGLQDLDIELP